MRATIVKSGGYLDKRIERILHQNNINGDIIEKLTRNAINHCDCIIFSYQNDIPNLPKVIEQVVLEKKNIVILVNNTFSIGYYYNIIDDIHFSMVSEATLDFELPFVIKNNVKFLKSIKQINDEKKQIENELMLLKNTNKAKRILMRKGFNEAESHKFIQQKAMALRVSKEKLVNLIIENKIDI
jgi:response regulator NasT